VFRFAFLFPVFFCTFGFIHTQTENRRLGKVKVVISPSCCRFVSFLCFFLCVQKMAISFLPEDVLDRIAEFDSDRLLKSSVDANGEYWQLGSRGRAANARRFRDLVSYARHDDRGFRLTDFHFIPTALVLRPGQRAGELFPRLDRAYFEIHADDPAANGTLVQNFLHFRMRVGAGPEGWRWGDRVVSGRMGFKHFASPFGEEGLCRRDALLNLVHLDLPALLELRGAIGGYAGRRLGDRMHVGYAVLPFGGDVRLLDLRRLLKFDILPNFLEFRRLCQTESSSQFAWGDRGSGYGLVDPDGLGVLNVSGLCKEVLSPEKWPKFVTLRTRAGGKQGCRWGDRGTSDETGLVSPSGEVFEFRQLQALF
jgi:hypothetical protein